MYIKRDALMRDVDDSMHKNLHENSALAANHKTEHLHFLSMIARQPSAIVYCKDCKFRDLAGAAPFMYHYCRNDNGLSGVLKEDDFCPYGATEEC